MSVKHGLTLREAEGVREEGAKEYTWALEGEGKRGLEECANKYLLLQFKLTSGKTFSMFFDNYDSKSIQIILRLLSTSNPPPSTLQVQKFCNSWHSLKYS